MRGSISLVPAAIVGASTVSCYAPIIIAALLCASTGAAAQQALQPADFHFDIDPQESFLGDVNNAVGFSLAHFIDSGVFSVQRDYQHSNGAQLVCAALATIGQGGANGPQPKVDLQVHLDSPVGPSVAHVSASINYFGVVTPKPNAPTRATVPLVIEMRGEATILEGSSGGGFVNAISSVAWSLPAGGTDGRSASAHATTLQPWQSYDQSFTVDIPVGAVFDASASVNVALDLIGVSSDVQGIADPLIYIDPAFPFRDDFELQFSGNLVPEANSLTLLALIGAAAPRRRPRRPPGLSAARGK